MNGIPVPVMRNGSKETVYLSTRRSGSEGEKLRAHKAAFREARNKALKLSTRIATLARAPAGATLDDLDGLISRQEAALDAMQEAVSRAAHEAEQVVLQALRENHGKEAEAIVDCLTDKQLADCVSIIETGDVPADFFPSPGIQPKPSSISGPGVERFDSSSHADSPATT